jgi:hypothetical protein
MFDPINTLLKSANSKVTRHTIEREPLQPITTTDSGASATSHPQLSVTTTLPNTADRVRQIQANLANNTRAEFASVINQLNASQGKDK